MMIFMSTKYSKTEQYKVFKNQRGKSHQASEELTKTFWEKKIKNKLRRARI